jgi:hypothetical protein
MSMLKVTAKGTTNTIDIIESTSKMDIIHSEPRVRFIRILVHIKVLPEG